MGRVGSDYKLKWERWEILYSFIMVKLVTIINVLCRKVCRHTEKFILNKFYYGNGRQQYGCVLELKAFVEYWENVMCYFVVEY